MVRLPKVPEGWLDAESGSPDTDFTSGGGSSGRAPSEIPGTSIGPVQGYPETGKNAWRAGNDAAILGAAGKYNKENGYSPGDPRYVSPQMMKSWMMQESGGHRKAFESDPFQVNVPGDWVADKARRAGLTNGQVMTPQTSADAALKWLQYKGSVHDTRGAVTSYRGITEISAGNGYSAGGLAVTGISSSQSGGTYKLAASADPSFTASGSVGPFQYAVLYNSTPASGNLIGWWDRGSALTLANTDTFTVDLDQTNGILQIS